MQFIYWGLGQSSPGRVATGHISQQLLCRTKLGPLLGDSHSCAIMLLCGSGGDKHKFKHYGHWGNWPVQGGQLATTVLSDCCAAEEPS